jgi:predicted GNAT family acetyltransferase
LLILERGDLAIPPAAPTRRGTFGDLDALTVAAANMHREEIGIDPLAVDPAAWRARMATLIKRGWSWAWVEDGAVVFKAELSAWTPEVVQIQGVYTSPARRGQGIATAGMAVLCADVLATVPTCSLYVNAYNTAAIALYERLGFRHRADFATYVY